MGLGVILDSATNQICDIEAGSSGEVAGLKKGDVIMVIGTKVVTSIVDGKISPRCAVSAAIDPNQSQLKLMVYRPANLPATAEEARRPPRAQRAASTTLPSPRSPRPAPSC
jgi:hypothetical protein